MKTLSTKLNGKRYAYVKDEVVFDIKTAQKENDDCVVEITEENCEVINVAYEDKNGDTVCVKYYLDTYIKDGDKYTQVITNNNYGGYGYGYGGYDSGKLMFVPNDDHRGDLIHDSFDTYVDLYRAEAVAEMANKMVRGYSFEDAAKTLPLYLKYKVGEEMPSAEKYVRILNVEGIEPIEKDEEDLTDYIIKLARLKAMEVANPMLKCIEKHIAEDTDIIISDIID